MRVLWSSLVLAAFVGVTPLLACDSTPPTGGTMTWSQASPDPNVITLTPASFSEGSGVTDAVRAECRLELQIPEEIARHTPVTVVLAADGQGGARVLTLEVTKILAPGGGAWSGPKSVTLHGELIQGGAVVASFDARRTTTRGAGTCEMLGYVVDALAKDIRPWLVAPTLNASLGEL